MLAHPLQMGSQPPNHPGKTYICFLCVHNWTFFLEHVWKDSCLVVCIENRSHLHFCTSKQSMDDVLCWDHLFDYLSHIPHQNNLRAHLWRKWLSSIIGESQTLCLLAIWHIHLRIKYGSAFSGGQAWRCSYYVCQNLAMWVAALVQWHWEGIWIFEWI